MENTSNNEIFQQLMYLRRITEITGVLHEAQIMHLKVYWGLVTDGTGKEFALDSENKVLEFRLPEDGVFLKNQAEWFFESVRTITGPGWKVNIKRGDQEISF
jgi:hypothetical protein